MLCTAARYEVLLCNIARGYTPLHTTTSLGLPTTAQYYLLRPTTPYGNSLPRHPAALCHDLMRLLPTCEYRLMILLVVQMILPTAGGILPTAYYHPSTRYLAQCASHLVVTVAVVVTTTYGTRLVV